MGGGSASQEGGSARGVASWWGLPARRGSQWGVMVGGGGPPRQRRRRHDSIRSPRLRRARPKDQATTHWACQIGINPATLSFTGRRILPLILAKVTRQIDKEKCTCVAALKAVMKGASQIKHTLFWSPRERLNLFFRQDSQLH